MKANMKVKFQGRKQKIELLGFNDVITDDCYQAMTTCADARTEDEYNMFIEEMIAGNQPFGDFKWVKTVSAGDVVNDCHTHRTYFKTL